MVASLVASGPRSYGAYIINWGAVVFYAFLIDWEFAMSWQALIPDGFPGCPFGPVYLQLPCYMSCFLWLDIARLTFARGGSQFLSPP